MSEPADTLYELRLGDGTRHIGRVAARGEDRLTFQSITGQEIDVNERFARLRPAPGRIVEGEYWQHDRNQSRLFFAPTARTLEPGQGYAGIFWILPFVGVAATENLTVAGGLPPAGSFGETPVWIAPKFRVENTPARQVSVGLLALYSPDYADDGCNPDFDPGCSREGPVGESELFGIGYGIATFGDRDRALHVGSGVAFGGESLRVPIMVGGENRLGRRWKLITENWAVPGEGGAGSIGFRRIGERWTWDFGWMALYGGDDDAIPYFPIISFSYSWGG